MPQGHLVIFEGPDGVGKSTVANAIAQAVSKRRDSLYYAFPGREDGSLGKVVYDIHHGHGLTIPVADPACLQLLHVAAHLDAISRVIRPALDRGTIVLLDRFWWSTRVYGIAGGIPERLLDAMLEVERMFWGQTKPALGILLTTDRSYRADERTNAWQQLAALYGALADRESHEHPVISVANQSDVESTVTIIMEEISALGLLET